MSNKFRLISQLNHSFGNGGMTSALENVQLVEYIQHLQRAHAGPMPVKKAVLFTGRQPDGTWVFNANCFISADGEAFMPANSSLVWLDKDLVFENDKIRSGDISPAISLPLSVGGLLELVSTMESITKHNFIPALLVVAGVAMAFHYEAVVELYGGCPITVATGESETGKSTAIRAGLSLFGCDEICRYVKGTNAAFMERASRSTLPFGIEDPAKGKHGKSKANQLDISELIIDLYNGVRSANLKTGSLKPQSVPVLASNFDVEELDRLADECTSNV